MMKKLAIAIAFLALLLLGVRLHVPGGVHAVSDRYGTLIARNEFGFGRDSKFGYNDDVDTATDPEDVWDCPDIGANSLRTPVSSGATLYISSDDEADAGLDYRVVGLDAAGELQSVSVTLGAATAGGTAAAMVGDASNWDDVFRAFNDDFTAAAGNIYIHIDSDVGADGIPDTPTTDIKACILIGEGQTLMTHYQIPIDAVGYLKGFDIGVSPAAVNQVERAVVELKSSVWDTTTGAHKVWRVQHKAALISNGNGIMSVRYDPPVLYGPRTRFRFEVQEVATDNTGVWAVIHGILEYER